ncbi:hypothetical protein KEU06_28790 [Pseudaminobacter sp. 19-2017]|uniref:Uncharacterized protein n=1 Tax=Pseudaminobacter soli (ex Zhang et al. 2022) TaxID=2831468 RepID=A0A942I4A6_9HYPH|nr:hypothetical protein [Pseudaminobacter soli]MBS3652577.1 hypothetical protein [Pseudaminobacter soli]
MSIAKPAMIVALLAAALSNGTTSANPVSNGCGLIKATFRNQIETIFLIEMAHFHLKDKYGSDAKLYEEALSHYNSKLSFKAANEISSLCPIG